MVCGVLMSQANILEGVATSQPTFARMETMEGLQARALVHRAHEGEATGGTNIQEVGSRSRSPTPESSLTPNAVEQEAINPMDIARILYSLHGSQTSPHVLLVATPLFSSLIVRTSVFFSTRLRVGDDVVACGISFW